MTKSQREAMLEKINTMPIEELIKIVKQAAEESGLTYEDIISTDWKKFFEEMRVDNG